MSRESNISHACQHGNLTALTRALSNGSNPNNPDSLGHTPLFYAIKAYISPIEKVRLLLQHGAHINQPTIKSKTPLSFLTTLHNNGRLGLPQYNLIACTLLQYGCNPFKTKETYNQLVKQCAKMDGSRLNTDHLEEQGLWAELKDEYKPLFGQPGRAHAMWAALCMGISYTEEQESIFWRQAGNTLKNLALVNLASLPSHFNKTVFHTKNIIRHIIKEIKEKTRTIPEGIEVDLTQMETWLENTEISGQELTACALARAENHFTTSHGLTSPYNTKTEFHQQLTDLAFYASLYLADNNLTENGKKQLQSDISHCFKKARNENRLSIDPKKLDHLAAKTYETHTASR